MEAVLATTSSSAENSISPHKQFKNAADKKRTAARGGFISKPTDNFAPTNYSNKNNNTTHGGHLLFAPLPPQPLSFSSYHPYPRHHHHLQQPPLLPLRVPKLHSSLPSRFTAITKPNKNNRRHPSSTPKKTQQQRPNKKMERKESPDLIMDRAKVETKCLVITSDGFGPPADSEKFSVSVFAMAPPPSSLPLPRFSARPRLISCNVEAAAVGNVDAGATDGLRRLLRLR